MTPMERIKKVLSLVSTAFPTLAGDGLSAAAELEQTIEQVEGAICSALAEVAKAQEGLASVTLERDALRARVDTAERDLDMARGLISRLGDPDSLESLWALLRYERARVAELERAQDAAFRDAHRAEADAARLREACTDIDLVGVAAYGELQNFARDLDAISSADNRHVRRIANQLRERLERIEAALASAPSAEPTRNQCDGCAAGRPVDAHGMHRMSDGDGFASNYQQCQAHRYAEPTPRDMRVAEAVREVYDRAIIVHGRLAAGAIDLAAVVAKAVGA